MRLKLRVRFFLLIVFLNFSAAAQVNEGLTAKIVPDISLIPQIGDNFIRSLIWSEEVGAVWSNPDTRDGTLLGILLKIQFEASLARIQINEGPYFSAKDLSEFKFVLRIRGMHTEGRIRVEFENGDTSEQHFQITIANWDAIKKLAHSSPLILSKLQYKFGAFLSDLKGYAPISRSTGLLLSKLSYEGNLLVGFNNDRRFQPYVDLQYRYVSFNSPASKSFSESNAKLVSLMAGLEKIERLWAFGLEIGVKPTLFYRAQTEDVFKIEKVSRWTLGAGISRQFYFLRYFFVQPKISIFWAPPKKSSGIDFSHDFSYLIEGGVSLMQSSNLSQYSLLPFLSHQQSQSLISTYSRLEYGLKVQFKQLYY